MSEANARPGAVNRRNLAAFLEALEAGALLELLLIVPDGRAVSEFFETAADLAERLVELKGDTRNLYVRAANRLEAKFGGGENGLENCAAAAAVWTDVDLADAAAREEFLAGRLAAFPIRPHAIVATGGGLHLWWWLEEPVDLTTPEGRAQVHAIQRGLADHLGGDRASCDANHAARVPGTINYPTAPKREAGRVAAPVELLELRVDTPRVALSDFEDFELRGAGLVAAKVESVITLEELGADLRPDAQVSAEDLESVIDWEPKVRPLFQRDTSHPAVKGLRDRSDSGIDQSLANYLAMAGWEAQAIADALIASRREHALKDRRTALEKATRPKYMADTLGKAIAAGREYRERMGAGADREAAALAELEVEPDAKPDPAKLDALLGRPGSKGRRLWNGEEFQDDRQRAVALAGRAQRAGWPTEDVGALVAAFLRDRGETFDLARVRAIVADARAAIAAGARGDKTTLDLAAEAAEARRRAEVRAQGGEAALAELADALRLHRLYGVVLRGRFYYLDAELGPEGERGKVRLGSFADLYRSQKDFLAPLAGAGVIVPIMKRAEWDSVAALLTSVRVIDTADPEREESLEWFLTYLGDRSGGRSATFDFHTFEKRDDPGLVGSVRAGWPFELDGMVYFRMGELARTVQSAQPRLSRAVIANRLEADLEAVRIPNALKVTVGGETGRARYWKAPLSRIVEPGETIYEAIDAVSKAGDAKW